MRVGFNRALLLGLLACSDEPSTPGNEPSTPGGEPSTPSEQPPADVPAQRLEPTNVGPGSVTAEPEDDAAHVYDPAVVHTFELEIAPAELQLADSDPKAEQSVPARLRFEGTTYEVGYRYKGSTGAFRPPCTLAFDGGPKDGKCSVKLSFNWKDPEARFFGLKKLVFHAMNKDPSMLRERLGYALFREMGVPAPRASHAILRVNGQADIYALVEEVDGRFARSRFAEGGKGNLYKEIWPIHADPNVYLAALETNEDQMPSAERILRFKDAVLQGPDAMAAWMDLDVTTSYVAVDRVIANDDGAFHFYCIAGGIGNNPAPPGNHNYYWYEAESADRLWIIPWDLDDSMSGSSGLPHIAVDWRMRPSAEACNACQSGGGFGALDSAAGCDRVVQNFHAWAERYDAKVDAFIAGPFSKAAIDEKLARWKQQILTAGFPVQEDAISQLGGILDRARINRGYAY